MNNNTKCLALFAVAVIASFLLAAAVLADQHATVDGKKNKRSNFGDGAKIVGSDNNDNSNNGKNNGARVIIHGGGLGAEFVW
ncbi:MAG TPA: hypothetical protein VE130_13585 [Nitrososphaeraceae archaeon]|nr:hypothetical protein [Nitrososphaeraceae archaeon]